MGKEDIAYSFPTMFCTQSDNCTPFVHIFYVIFLFAAELKEPKIGIWGNRLNDSVSFIRFSLNGRPHIKTSGPINRLSLFSTNAHCRSLDRIFPCNRDASHTTNKLQCLLNFKTRTVTECDYSPASALTEPGNKKIGVQNCTLQNFNMWSMYVQSFKVLIVAN